VSSWLPIIGAIAITIAAFASGRAMRSSPHASEPDDSNAAGPVRLSRTGKVNGINYWPLRIAVTPTGLLFSSLGMRIKVPYAAITTETKHSVLFTYVHIASKVDPKLRIRISQGLAKELSELSGGKFSAA
jgi:hypothetical protein